MVDPERLRALLERIGDELTHLDRLAQVPADELVIDSDRMAAVKYRFVVAIEAAIDACHHVAASEGLTAPADFAQAFVVVAEAGFLPADGVAAWQEMARFRNLLVHGYAGVDDARVVAILRDHRADLDQFRRELARAALG
jgi:uncharacterized protein YutE (UPF0331/DUF86 family)